VASLLVARHGRLVFERYYRGERAADRLPVFSITKSFISALIGIALADGSLRSIDESLVRFLPEGFGPATDARARSITLRQLLTMTAGFFRTPPVRPDDPVPALINRPLYANPGTTFSYDGGSSDLLSAVLTRATGMTAADYAERHLFAPLGIRGARWAPQADGSSQGAVGLALRPRDLLAFGQLYLDGGTWRGSRVLPVSWVDVSTRQHVQVGRDVWFGYHWWIVRGPVRFFAALGYGGQAIVVAPRLDEVVVITGSSDDPKPRFTLARLVMQATRDAPAKG
jgi:CubicO group peptidase (beta-lactamase class C family)